MDKKYIVTFSISVLVLFTVGIIMLMLLTPQQVSVVDVNQNEYQSLTRSTYTFEKTKDISQESLVQEYSITTDDILNSKKYNNYNPGKSDPFTPQSDLNNGSNNNNQPDATDKTTNGNDGVENPPSSGK